MGRDVQYRTFFSKEDLDLYQLRLSVYYDRWKEGTTEEQKRQWGERFRSCCYGWEELLGARNTIPLMEGRVFSYKELVDYIKQMVEEGEFEAVKWLGHIAADTMEDGYVIIDSC